MLRISLLFTALLPFTIATATASPLVPIDEEFDEILSRDIADLTVTSVSKRAQRLNETAAATYVITQEQIRRAGVYSIPDALRLAPGVQVAKIDSERWAVSARGFNGALSNKLLVLIDGRAVYTPIFSGVYWGDQSTSINDIDRIEVIRGPGASLYGSNAVNGVINIITKPAEATQGNLISATTTIRGNGLYEARHGGEINPLSHYRVYGQYVDNSSSFKGRGGFRIDGKTRKGNQYTLQGDAYGGQQDVSQIFPSLTAPFTQKIFSTNDSYGANVLGRWNRTLHKDSEVSIQTYVDHYTRLEANFEQQVSTADMQLQHNLRLNERNNFIWGFGGRLYYLDLKDTYLAHVNDQYDTHHIIDAFAQNEYEVVPDTLFITLGSKFEFNDFTGFELQPSARMAWHPDDNQTIWAAISRAVRIPSSYEEDISLLGQVTAGPTELRIIGNPHQQSEELIAYELGHRIQATDDLFFDSTIFFNDYKNLQTISTAGPSFTGESGNTVIPYTFNNLGAGHSYGAEVAATWNINDKWRLAGSYTYLKLNLEVKPGSVITLDSTESQSPRQQFSIQSYYNISSSVHWDNMLYYVSDLSSPVNDYIRYDTRIAWLVQPGLELSLIGRNVADPHVEFPSSNFDIDRTLIGQVLWKF